VGATTTLNGLQFTVDRIEHNRIAQVFVERPPEAVAAPDDGTGGQPEQSANEEQNEERKHV
jgi:hypothetical protein